MRCMRPVSSSRHATAANTTCDSDTMASLETDAAVPAPREPLAWPAGGARILKMAPHAPQAQFVSPAPAPADCVWKRSSLRHAGHATCESRAR